MRLTFLSVSLLLASCLSAVHAAAPMQTTSAVKLIPLPDRVRVEIEGQLFTEYIFKGAERPYLYPIVMPDGVQVVRDFPMKVTSGEETDHTHHRSLWFAHGVVNGVDFWADRGAGQAIPKGTIVHDALVETSGGSTGTLRSRERWTGPDGTLICTSETTIRIRGTAALRTLDYEVSIRATAEKPLILGDSKEGTMAIRLAKWMTLPHRYKQQAVPGEGHFVLSTGARDAETWGKRAAWCDAFAPRDGKIYGVAIFDHPKNLRHPTWWMARDYGLFAANPFGQHEFENLKDRPNIGDHTIPPGGTLTLRYRFVFHFGDDKSAGVAALYDDYVAGK